MKLHDIVNDWGPDQPDNLISLMEYQYDKLDSKAKAVRAMAVDLVHSFERLPIHTARDALALMEKHHLPVRKNLWTIVALNSSRERVYVRSANGMRLLHTVSKSVPDKVSLLDRVPLPEGGKYLALYGGEPGKVSAEDVSNLTGLTEAGDLVDILFWDVSESPAVFYSARAGVQSRGAGQLEKRSEERLSLW